MKNINQTFLSLLVKLSEKGFFEYWRNLVNDNQALMVLIGILLPIIEAIFPPIPLIAIVSFNMANLGVIQGSIITIIGSSIGTYLVFLILNMSVGKKIRKNIGSMPKVLAATKWLEKRSMAFYIIAMGNPYMPTAIFNYAFSLSNIDKKKYAYIVVISRIFLMSFIGFLAAVFNLKDNPLAIIWILLTYALLYIIVFAYRKILNYINNKKVLKK